MRSADIKIALGLAAAFVLLNLVAIERAPLVWIDEVILVDPAKELALHGQFRSSIYSDFDFFRGPYFWHPPAQQLITALIFKLFGFGLWQGRLAPIVFGGLAAAVFYLLALELFGRRRAALLAALVFALDPKVIQVARSARMDMQALFFAFLAMLLLVRADARENGRDRRLAAGGLALGVSGVTHFLAAFWAVAIGVYTLFFGTREKARTLIVFGAFAALPSIIWLAWALQTPDLFAEQFSIHGKIHLTHGGVLQRTLNELLRYPKEMGATPLLLVAWVAALVWLIRAATVRRQAKALILISFFTLFILNAIVMKKAGGYYYLHPNSILSLALGAMLDAILPQRLVWPLDKKKLAAVAFTALLFLNLLAAGLIGHYLIWAIQWSDRDYSKVETEIAKYIPPGSVVFAKNGTMAYYAIVKAGSSLRLGPQPQPNLHDYVIMAKNQPHPVPPGYVLIAEIGAEPKKLFGRWQIMSYYYQMLIYARADRVPPGVRPDASGPDERGKAP